MSLSPYETGLPLSMFLTTFSSNLPPHCSWKLHLQYAWVFLVQTKLFPFHLQTTSNALLTFSNLYRSCLLDLGSEDLKEWSYSLMLQITSFQFQYTLIHRCNKQSDDQWKVVWVQKNISRKYVNKYQEAYNKH